MTDDAIIRALEANGVRFLRIKAPRGEIHLTFGAVPASQMVRAVRAVMARADTSASSRIGTRPDGPTFDDPLFQRGL